MMPEEKEKARIRLRDAIEFLDTARESLIKGRNKSALLTAGDAVIAANDAFTLFLIERLATRDHSEAIVLHKEAGRKINQNMVDVLKHLLDERHKKGYRAVEVSKALAESNLRQAEKFVKWVKETLISRGLEL